MTTTPRTTTRELLTPRETAARFGVGLHTVRRWADAGRLTVVRTIGGHRRYLASQVEELAGAEGGVMLTPGQVAGLFDVDAGTVSRWAADGLIPSTRILGGHYRYREDDVRALLAERTSDAVS